MLECLGKETFHERLSNMKMQVIDILVYEKTLQRLFWAILTPFRVYVLLIFFKCDHVNSGQYDTNQVAFRLTTQAGFAGQKKWHVQGERAYTMQPLLLILLLLYFLC